MFTYDNEYWWKDEVVWMDGKERFRIGWCCSFFPKNWDAVEIYVDNYKWVIYRWTSEDPQLISLVRRFTQQPPAFRCVLPIVDRLIELDCPEEFINLFR